MLAPYTMKLQWQKTFVNFVDFCATTSLTFYSSIRETNNILKPQKICSESGVCCRTTKISWYMVHHGWQPGTRVSIALLFWKMKLCV